MSDDQGNQDWKELAEDRYEWKRIVGKMVLTAEEKKMYSFHRTIRPQIQ